MTVQPSLNLGGGYVADILAECLGKSCQARTEVIQVMRRGFACGFHLQKFRDGIRYPFTLRLPVARGAKFGGGVKVWEVADQL